MVVNSIMKKALIGIRREDKNPWERRVPLIPTHVRELMAHYPVEIWVQPSPVRIFSDEEYRREGARVEEDLSPCDIVLAVKEIPIRFFRQRRVYAFFSHTSKGQPHNMPMLKRMVALGCTLIDYEKIVDESGRRLVFFGRQAGYAGMIDTLWALGRRLEAEGIKKNPFAVLKRTYEYASLVEAKEEIQKMGWEIYRNGLDGAIVPLVFGFMGYGHVSQGAQEIFDLLPFEEIPPRDIPSFFKNEKYAANHVYKSVFREEDMVSPARSGEVFDLHDYYALPVKYTPVFESYLPYLTVVVNGIYWAPRFPRFITKSFLRRMYEGDGTPRLRVIGDISCDVEGAVECTVRTTSPDHPVFMYDPLEDIAFPGVAGRGPVVLAVDNLPAEISLESSIFFSQVLKDFIPGLAAVDFSGDFESCRLPDPLKKAVILFRGEFAPEFAFMRNFIA